jgi:hypothetical protein
MPAMQSFPLGDSALPARPASWAEAMPRFSRAWRRPQPGILPNADLKVGATSAAVPEPRRYVETTYCGSTPKPPLIRN